MFESTAKFDPSLTARYTARYSTSFESTAKFDPSLTKVEEQSKAIKFESTAKFDPSLTKIINISTRISLRVLLNLILLLLNALNGNALTLV